MLDGLEAYAITFSVNGGSQTWVRGGPSWTGRGIGACHCFLIGLTRVGPTERPAVGEELWSTLGREVGAYGWRMNGQLEGRFEGVELGLKLGAVPGNELVIKRGVTHGWIVYPVPEDLSWHKAWSAACCGTGCIRGTNRGAQRLLAGD